MNFVDEQDDVATGANFLQHFLEALFKVTAVAATCNECTKVKCVELLVSKRHWNVIANDLLCEAFNDCGLTNTWLTNEHWVVLGTTRKNLHDALNFFFASYEWVKLAFASKLCEVATELIKYS